MRPKKENILMSEWSKVQLLAVLNSDESSEKLKSKVQKIFDNRVKKGKEFLKAFYNQTTPHKGYPYANKFIPLALWQLHREGKSKFYGTGKHKKFHVKNTLDVLDKAYEIRKAYGKFETGKNSIKTELKQWKR